MRLRLNIISPVILLFIFFLNNHTSYSQWLPAVRLTNDTSESIGTYNNAKWIAANGNKIHIVWRDMRSGFNEVYYKRTTDNGLSWSNDYKINDAQSECFGPSVAVSGRNVYIVWSDSRNAAEDIYYIKSTNWGNTWGPNIRLTNTPFVSGDPVISCSGSNINICWTDLRDGNAEIYFKNSSDEGVSWSNDVRLTNAPSVSQFPSLAQNSLTLHVVWDDWRDGQNKDIFYKRSSDGGLTWSADILLSNTPLTVWGQTISVAGLNVHVAYMVQTSVSRFEIFYKNSHDGGITWNPEVNLSNTISVGAVSPSIISYGSVVHLVWLENNNNTRQIKYKRSTNNGLSWDTSEFITSNAVQSDNPCLAASNSALHVVWNDKRDGNNEIYYKKNQTCNGAFTVSGLVTFKDNNQPVNGGYVKALKYIPETTEIITVDSSSINSNGTYQLNHMPDDVLDLMFYQDDDLLQFVPTYYESTIDWRQSTKIHPTQNLTDINCKVYRINNQTNPYIISGQITANLDYPAILSMKDAVIYAKIGDEFKNYGVSNNSGSYAATKLPPGNYDLITYRMGFAPVSQNVTITNGSISNVNFDLGSPLIGINIINMSVPKTYTLNQNYPNPFNPSTNVKFEIPSGGLIKLAVYDILGREIETLVNENLAAGSYSVNWNASNYPSGIYFYRIETSNFTETKKMVLIK